MPLRLNCPNPDCGASQLVDEHQAHHAHCSACGHPFGSGAAATLCLLDQPPQPVLSTGPDNALAASATLSLPIADTVRPGPALARLGRFEVRERLGEGAFGEVFRAYDPQLDREVALKVAKTDALTTPGRVERFLREAKAAANLRHPNIVPLYETGRDGGRYFIASAYIRGRTLEKELDEAFGPIAFGRAATLIRRLAEALGYAHRQGIVHRDVKPANVLVDESGEPMLTDFGLAARRLDEERVTHEKAVLGTPAYMSPEQAAGKSGEAGPAADQYALGVMIYEMLTGQRPFDGPVEVVVFQQMKVEPVRPGTLNRAIPKDLETICLKCLEKEPAKRYPDCEELAEELRRWLDGEPVKARRLTWAERGLRWTKRNPAMASLIFGVVASVLIGGLGIYVKYLDANEQKGIANDKATLALQLAGEKATLAETNAGLADSERRQREMAERETARLRYERGVALCEEGNVGRGMLWLAHSLPPAVSARATDLEQTARLNLDSWRREAPALLAVLPHPSKYQASMTLSPDGRVLVTASDDGSVRFWNAATGEPIGEPVEGEMDEGFSKVKFCPDGQTVLLRGSGATCVRVLQTATRKCIGRLACDSTIIDLALSPDGSIVFTGEDKAIRFWGVATCMPKGSAIQHPAGLLSIACSPDGKSLATTCKDRIARLWGLQTRSSARQFQIWPNYSVAHFGAGGERLFTSNSPSNGYETPEIWDCNSGARVAAFANPPPPPQSNVDPSVIPAITDAGLAAIAKRQRDGGFSNIRTYDITWDGELILLAEGFGAAKFVDFATGRQVGAALALKHDTWVTSVAISPDRRLVASGSDDRTARIWDVETGVPVGPALEHSSRVKALRFSPDGQTLYTQTEEGTVRLWRIVTQTPHGLHLGYFSANPVVRFFPDGKKLVAGTTLGCRAFDVQKGVPIDPLGKLQLLRSVAVSRDGQKVAAGGSFGGIHLYDAAMEKLTALSGHTGGVVALEFSPCGTWLASGGWDNPEGTVRLWDVATGQPVGAPLKSGDIGFAQALAFSPDGKKLVTGIGAFTQLWEVPSGRMIGKNEVTKGFVKAVAISPDGKSALTGTNDGAALLLNADTGTPIGPPMVHRAAVNSVCFSPDGQLVLTASDDNTAQIWVTKTGKPHGGPLHHKGPVNKAVFSPNGQVVITGSKDGVVRMWEAASTTPLTPSYKHRGEVYDLSVSPDGLTVAIACRSESSIWLRQIPNQLAGNVDQLVAWTQTLTGLELEPYTSTLRSFDARSWAHQRDRLNGAGGSPIQPSPEAEQRLAWHRATAEYATYKSQSFTARWHLDPLLAADPDNAELLDMRSIAHSKLNQSELCIRDCTHYLEQKPESAEVLVRRGLAYQRLNKLDLSLADFARACQLSPRDSNPLARMGYVCLLKRDFKAGIEYYTRAIELRKDQWWYWMERGDCCGWLQQWPAALADYSAAIKLNAGNAQIWQRCGIAHNSLEKWEKAIADFDEMARLAPDNPDAWILRGNTWFALRRYDQSVADYSKAIQMRQENADCWVSRADAYLRLNDAPKALADLNEAVQRNPRHARAFNLRGNTHFRLSQWAKAIADYSRAIELSKEDAVFWNNRGNAYRKLNQADQAIADCAEAIRLQPKNAEYRANRAAAYSDTKQWAVAVKDWDQAIELKKDVPGYWTNRAQALAALGERKKALDDYAQALRLKPDDASIWNQRAIERIKQGLREDALADCMMATNLKPDVTLYWRNRGAIQAQLNRWPDAATAYRQAVALPAAQAAFWVEYALVLVELFRREAEKLPVPKPE